MGSWKDVLAQVAPTIATAFGGPMAGAATAWLGGKLLGKDGATQDDIAAAMGNPDTLLKLKQLELDYQAHLKELGIKLEELDTSDRNSARQLAIARGIYPQVGISLLFLGGYFGLMAAIIAGWARIPAEYHDLAVTLIGVLTAGVPQVLNFWLGSSHGSQQKDATLASAALNP